MTQQATSVPNHRFHRMLMASWLFEQTWRTAATASWDYYDGAQWTEEEKDILETRGQQASVLNVIRPTIDMVMSIEMDRRMDIQVVPREDGDEEVSKVLTELLKQVYDNNDFDFYLGKGFREGLITGRGWMQVASDEKDGKQQIVVTQFPWEEGFIDPYHRKPDGSDARYVIREIWMDRDEVMETWPDKAEDIQRTFTPQYRGQEDNVQSNTGERGFSSNAKKQMMYYDTKSERIAVCECWYKDAKGNLRLVIFSEDICLQGSFDDDAKNESPYKKLNTFPIIPIYSFRKHTGEPKGLPEYLTDMQDMLNKENSKFIWSISGNRLLVEDGAVDDFDEMRAEWNRPDAVVRLNANGLAKTRTEDNLRESQFLMSHMQFLIGMVQRTSGINDSMIGIGGQNERSAEQMRGRILQGTAMQTSIMENLFFAKKQITRVVLMLIGETYSAGTIVRIVGSNGEVSNVPLNKEVIDGYTGQPVKINKIDDILRYDVVLKYVPPFSTVRQNTLTTFAEVAKSGILPPQIVGEILVGLSDLPNKQEILVKLNQMNQMAMQQAQAAQQAQMQAQPPVA